MSNYDDAVELGARGAFTEDKWATMPHSYKRLRIDIVQDALKKWESAGYALVPMKATEAMVSEAMDTRHGKTGRLFWLCLNDLNLDSMSIFKVINAAIEAGRVKEER